MSRMRVFKAKSLLTHGNNLISRLRVMSIMSITANKHKEYWQKQRELLNQLEVNKVIKLSHAAKSIEKLF